MTDSGDGAVRVELHGDVAHVRLDRPERLNALCARDFDDLTLALEEVAVSGCRVAVLSAAGTAFCAGLDLVEGLGEDIDAAERTMRSAAAAVASIRELPVPVVGAVQGAAVGVGLALVLACSVVYASPDATFSAPFVRLGLSAGDPGLTWSLPRVLGPARAHHLLFTGGSLDAEAALALGLVLDVTPQPLEAATATAHAIAGLDTDAVQATKRLLLAADSGSDLRSHLELELQTQVVRGQSGAFRSMRSAFVDRRHQKADRR